MIFGICDRYLFRTVMAATLVTLFTLVALESLFLLLREADDLADGSLQIGDLLVYLGLSLPGRVVEVLPMAFLIGGLLGMGSLASGSELVVMRAAGMSVLRLVRAAMLPGLLLVAVAVLVSEYVAPELSQQATRLLAEAKGRSLDIRRGRGFWVRDGQQLIQVRKMSAAGALEDILIFDLDDDFRLLSLARAERAEFVEDGWRLSNLTSTRLLESGAVVAHEYSRPWQVQISPELLKVLALEPHQMSIRDLTVYVRYLNRNGLDSSRYRLARWSKLLAPATNLIMLFIAMPFVFGAMRSAAGGKRLFVGIVLGILFFLVNRTLGSLGLVYGFSPIVSAVLPPALFLAGGLIAMSRVR